MTEKLTLREAVKIFFTVSLGRSPGESELELYESEYLKGYTLQDLALTISESDEARDVLINRLFSSMSIKDFVTSAAIINSSILVPTDDIMSSVATAYELFIGRSPTFREVYDHFVNLKQGAKLSDVLSLIATCEEAVSAKDQMLKIKSETKDTIRLVMQILYREFLERPISEEEVDIWYNNHQNGAGISDIISALSGSEEANTIHSNKNFSELSPGKFIQELYNILQNRGPTPSEITHFRERIESKQTSPELLLRHFFLHAVRERAPNRQNASVNDPNTAFIFGATQPYITIDDWNKKLSEGASENPKAVGVDGPKTQKVFRRFRFTSTAKPLVSIITSLFKGGQFVKTFMENMVEQSIFANCELIIIDANSPDHEYETIKKYQNSFNNIIYRRTDTRIGIYQAWNIAIEQARGLYCTNANLDDCRRVDSIEIQASTLDALAFVDIVYQDVLYSFKENLPFSEIERCGFSTSLPIISRYNLMEFNSPHNGPMWRRRLHDEIGLFDGSLQSAGDFDFWLRCHIAGKTFFKVNDPHVGYYVNPQGLSTRADTKGSIEAETLSRKYYNKIVSENITCSETSFDDLLKPWLSQNSPITTRYGKVQAALRRLSAASRLEHRV